MRPDPSAPSDRIELIRHALSGRLRDVRNLVPATTSPGAAPTPGHPQSERGPAATTACEPEETLRRLMVSVLARARDRPGPGPDRALFFALLSDLEAPARSADLRFLDAWNSASEFLLTWPREELERDDARGALQAYASLLETHLLRMEGRP